MQAVTITQISAPELETLIENAIRKILSTLPTNLQSEQEQLLTIQQAGEFLNLSVPTLYGYVQRSEIPVCKRGKRLYFSKQELTEWIKSARKKTITETATEAIKYINSKTR